MFLIKENIILFVITVLYYAHTREGKRIRKDDDTLTFGKLNENTGYMKIGTE